MYWNYIAKVIEKAYKMTTKVGDLPELEPPEFRVEVPKKKEYGDYSCNIALSIGNKINMDPSLVARKLVTNIDFPPSFCQRVSVSSKGFINIILSKESLHAALLSIVFDRDKQFSSLLDIGKEEKVMIVSSYLSPIEFLNVDESRKIVIGEFLRNLLASTNFNVTIEPLIRDCGDSIKLLGPSVEARYRELLGDDSPFPQDGIKNRFMVDLAKDILNEDGAVYLQVTKAERTNLLREKAIQKATEYVKKSLKNLGIEYRNWFSAKQLIEKEHIAPEIREKLNTLSVIYENDGKTLVRSTDSGDKKDRVLFYENNEPSDFMLELCFLLYNMKRGYTRNIFLKNNEDALDFYLMASSVLKILGYPARNLEVLPVEKVKIIMKSSEDDEGEIKKGESLRFDELFKLVGRDAIRFFFLLKNIDSLLDFDIHLTQKESNINPLYYIQSACNRLKGLFKMAETQGLYPLKYEQVNLRFLEQEVDVDLLKKTIQFPSYLNDTVRHLDPYPLIYYSAELVNDFHNYYSSVKIFSNDNNLTKVRLLLVEAVKIVLFRLMDLLKIKIPEKN